jgi:hypothetical protein
MFIARESAQNDRSQNPQHNQDGHDLDEGKAFGISTGHFAKHKNLKELPKSKFAGSGSKADTIFRDAKT